MTKIRIKRKPEYKQLNFDTAIRNPERLKGVLEVLNDYEGSILNDETILNILYDLYTKEIVRSSNLDLSKFKEKNDIKNKIVEINKTRKSDGDFPAGYQSRFWTYMRTLSEFGFVYSQYNEELIIGDVSKKLLKGKIDSQEAFGLQIMKYNWKSPYRNVSNDFNYFKFIIKVLRLLSKCNKRLSYNQFVVSLFEKEDNPSLFIERIENNLFPTIDSVYEYLENEYGKQNAKNTVLYDYPDTVLRMLRISGFVNIVNEGITLLEVNPDSTHFVDHFIDKNYIVSDDEKTIASKYFKKINRISNEEMNYIFDNREVDVKITNYNSVLKKVILDYNLNKEKTINLLKNIGIKGTNRDFKYIDDPLQFEFFISILLFLIFGDKYNIKPNYKTDSYGIPISHAPGNCGDIEVTGDGKYWLIEVTLIRSKVQQLNYETANLFRHVSAGKWDEKYMSLVAPVIHDDTYSFFNALILNYVNEYKNNSFNAKCYDEAEFIDVCLNKNVFDDMKKYTRDYEKDMFDILKDLV